jgi:hypothetical protein
LLPSRRPLLSLGAGAGKASKQLDTHTLALKLLTCDMPVGQSAMGYGEEEDQWRF